MILAGEAARRIGVSVRTLATWADRGLMRHERTAAGWRLYRPADVARMRTKLAARATRR